MMWIVLASRSPRREMLLRGLGLVFDIMPSNIDESLADEKSPEKTVELLAKAKAEAIAPKAKPGSIVIGADTIVCIDGKALGKPKDLEEAKSMLRLLSDREHKVYTGVCVINNSTHESKSFSEATAVKFRALSGMDIGRYSKDALDYAGAYAIQEQPTLIEYVKGSFTNVIGLPTERLVPILREYGVGV
jgi:septum formation protein